LLLTQEGVPMCSLYLNTRDGSRQMVVALHGDLDVTDAASVAHTLITAAARDRQIIIDLAGLENMDSSGLAALVLARKYARQVGGDLLLAAPQRQALRLLAVTRLMEILSVHDGVEDAVDSAERSRATALATLPAAS
jgi:anti-sigma B factor antagonist